MRRDGQRGSASPLRQIGKTRGREWHGESFATDTILKESRSCSIWDWTGFGRTGSPKAQIHEIQWTMPTVCVDGLPSGAVSHAPRVSNTSMLCHNRLVHADLGK